MAGNLDPTLPQTFVVDDDNLGLSEDEEPVNTAWGKLLPDRPGFDLIELVEDEYSFGRHATCTIKFTDPAISNRHCTIRRERPKEAYSQYDEDEFVVKLTDTSSNGTFVDNQRVGKGNHVVLRHNALIELTQGKKTTPRYVFHMGQSSMQSSHPAIEDRYNLTKPLGTGACGEVHLAIDKRTGRKYAVKIISKRKFTSTVGSSIGVSDAQVMAEVDILLKINHPNVIHVHDVENTPSHLYIVLELASGGELFDRIVDKEKFSEDVSKFYFLQMLDAVKYLHDQNIAHRDLKPENILLTSKSDDSLIKITDFGLAKLVGPQSFMKTMCGTPSYQAPEVLKMTDRCQEEGYGKAADMWSLGVILYIMLCGFPPFSEDLSTDLSLAEQILTGTYTFLEPYWDDISDSAKDMVSKLLVLDPSQRLTVEAALQHPFLQDDLVREQVKQKQTVAIERRLQVGNTQTSAIRRFQGEANGDATAAPTAKRAKDQ